MPGNQAQVKSIDNFWKSCGHNAPNSVSFWATHAGAELDLLVMRGNQRRGFEIKRTTAPAVTPSMRHAVTDLKLDRLEIIHAGEHSFPLTDRIQAVAARDLGKLERLR